MAGFPKISQGAIGMLDASATDNITFFRHLSLPGGLDTLLPNVRSDKGISRALNDEAINEIYRLKKDPPA